MIDFQIKFYAVYAFLILFAVLNALIMDLSKKRLVKEPFIVTICMIGFFIYFFGTRDYSIGTDTPIYLWQYTNFGKMDYGTDFLVPVVLGLLNAISSDPRIFFLFMAVAFLVPITISLRRVSNFFQSNWFLVFFSFVSFFFFISLSINVIRQAVSLGFLMLGITNYCLKVGGKRSWILPLIISVGFHFTSIVPAFIFLFVTGFRKFNLLYFYVIYLGAIFIASLEISILQLGIVGQILMDDRRGAYLNAEDTEYEIGFRPNFVIFNTFFLVIATFVFRKLQETEVYRFFLMYYILMSSFFFVTFQIPYSDRWGVISWIVIPFLLSPIFSLRFPYKIAIMTVIMLVGIFLFFQNYG